MTSGPTATASRPSPSDIDWTALRCEAVAASGRAYVPYSKFPVGVAALTTHGRVITGCNVENAAYGVTLCAECGLVSALVNGPDGTGPVYGLTAERELLIAASCVDGTGAPITPCGRCRQLLFEHAVPGMLLEMDEGPPVTLDELLPRAFGAPNLSAVPTSAEHLKGDS